MRWATRSPRRTPWPEPSSNRVKQEGISMSGVNTKNIPADKLVRVTFEPEGKTVEFEYGTMPYDHHGKPMSFLDVAENFDIFLDHACGGSGACTTCHIWVK